MSEWNTVVVGRYVELINGFAFPSTGFTEDEGIPLIRIRDLNSCDTEVNFCGKYPERYVVNKGDLLIGMDGDFSTIRWKGMDAILNQRVCKLVTRDSEGLVQDFLYYRIIEEIAAINRITAGTTVKHLSSKDILEIEINLPSSSEQAKIAEILSTVDQAIEQTEALIAKWQRIKTGLMQDLLTRGIDDDGNLRTEDTHEFKDSPLGRIPVEWEIASVGSVAETVTSGPRGWANYYREEGALFLRIGNLTREHINLRLDDLVFVQPPKSAEGLRTAVQPDDLLISVTADLGIIGVIPKDFGEGFVNQHIALARLLPADVSARFVGWFLSSQKGRAQFDTLNESGAKAGLNLPTVRSLLFPRPDDVDEQHRIAVAIDACVRTVDQQACNLQKLRGLKRGLMQDLLTGNRRVTALLEQPEGVMA